MNTVKCRKCIHHDTMFPLGPHGYRRPGNYLLVCVPIDIVCRYYVHADQCPGWVPLPSPIVGSYDEQNRTYEKEYDGQGRYYKDLNAYAVQAGVCYISEPSDRPYTHADFLQIAHGNSRLANYLFESVNWQSPETLFNDLLNAGEITKEGVFVE